MKAWGANSSHGGQTETPWETLRNEKKEKKKTRQAMVMTFSGWDREGGSALLTAVPQVRGEAREKGGLAGPQDAPFAYGLQAGFLPFPCPLSPMKPC